MPEDANVVLLGVGASLLAALGTGFGSLGVFFIRRFSPRLEDGLLSLVRHVGEKHDATAISLGGFPAYLTSEYLVRCMAGQGLLRTPVHLFSVVDYDPAGYWIEREFIKQLGNYQVEVASIYSLVNPADLPVELVDACRYRLKKDSRTLNWLGQPAELKG